MGLGLENPLHIAIIVVVVLLVFGAKRLPEMGRSIGQGMRGFKDGLTTAPSQSAEGSSEPRSGESESLLHSSIEK